MVAALGCTAQARGLIVSVRFAEVPDVNGQGTESP